MRYFSKAQLDLSQRSARERLLELDNPYREHQLLWQLFPDAAKRDFLFARASEEQPTYYLVSASKPLAPTAAWIVQTRDYQPQLSVGEQLLFKLRANPVSVGKTPRTPQQHQAWLENRKRKGLSEKDPNHVFSRRIRHDVVMQAKRDLGWKSLPEDERPLLAELAQQAGTRWLIEREPANGFRLHPDSLRVDGYFQHRFSKKGSGLIRFSSLEFEGLLTVIDPAMFVEKALFNGIGPAKAFGCGLLLVRRV